MILLQLLTLLLLVGSSEAALPTCTGSARCPTGGMWSEWAISGPRTCPTICGSCSKLAYTRTCLSTSIGCACSGDSFKYSLCNTQACLYANQRSCCDPYVSMIINNTLRCGPFPKDTSSPNVACCPSGGLWSDWSGWARDQGTITWYRTRQCLSTSLDCPCSGSARQTQTTCPCPTMKGALEVRQLCIINKGLYDASYSPNSIVINQDTCELTGITKANNDDIDYPCWWFDTYKPFAAGKIHVHGTDSTCYIDRPYDCEARKEYGTAQKTLNITFTCDPSIGQWRYDGNGMAADGYVLIQISYRGGNG